MGLEDFQTHENFEDQDAHEENSRFIELLQAIQRLTKLQEEAISFQIDARWKRRAAGFKRREVSTCDAKFGEELQRFMTDEKLKDFDGA